MIINGVKLRYSPIPLETRDKTSSASYYPHIIALYGLDPKHIPNNLLGKQLMMWYNERKSKYPKKTHFTLNYAIKIIINL